MPLPIRGLARRSVRADGVDAHRSRSGITGGGVRRRALPEREGLTVTRDGARADVVFGRSRDVYDGVRGDGVEVRASADDPLAGRASGECVHRLAIRHRNVRPLHGDGPAQELAGVLAI